MQLQKKVIQCKYYLNTSAVQVLKAEKYGCEICSARPAAAGLSNNNKIEYAYKFAAFAVRFSVKNKWAKSQ